MLFPLAILTLLFLPICGFFLFLFDSFFGKEDFSTSRLVVEQVIKIIQHRHLENARLYDLGSCRGNFAVKIARVFPEMKIVGIDDSWLRTLLAKTRGFFLKNVSFTKADIFSSDISSAEIIFIYLPQEIMPDLQTKLKKELKFGTLIIANRVTFPDWQPVETYTIGETDERRGSLGKIFVYQIV